MSKQQTVTLFLLIQWFIVALLYFDCNKKKYSSKFLHELSAKLRAKVGRQGLLQNLIKVFNKIESSADT